MCAREGRATVNGGVRQPVGWKLRLKAQWQNTLDLSDSCSPTHTAKSPLHTESRISLSISLPCSDFFSVLPLREEQSPNALAWWLRWPQSAFILLLQTIAHCIPCAPVYLVFNLLCCVQNTTCTPHFFSFADCSFSL